VKVSPIGILARVAAAAALAAAVAMPASAASIVVNGSFETGVPGNTAGLNNGALFGNLNNSGPSWDRWTAINGWTTTSGSGIEVQSNRTLDTIDAQDGTHYVELDSNSNSSMAQTLSLGVGKYLLSFWYSPRTSDPATNGIEYAIGTIAGGKVKNGVPVGANVGTWIQIKTLFDVVKAGNYKLQFAAVGTNDTYGGLIDNVSVAPVPLPAAGFGLMAALGGLAAVRRRRKA
jgi:hypothetical protein